MFIYNIFKRSQTYTKLQTENVKHQTTVSAQIIIYYLQRFLKEVFLIGLKFIDM